MDKSIYSDTTSVISISSKNIKDCSDVANTLAKCGIMCSVTPNYTVRRDMDEYTLENGCTIILGGTNPNQIEKNIWKPLKETYNLGCAFLDIHGGYKGCIIDYFTPSKCPGKQ